MTREQATIMDLKAKVMDLEQQLIADTHTITRLQNLVDVLRKNPRER